MLRRVHSLLQMFFVLCFWRIPLDRTKRKGPSVWAWHETWTHVQKLSLRDYCLLTLTWGLGAGSGVLQLKSIPEIFDRQRMLDWSAEVRTLTNSKRRPQGSSPCGVLQNVMRTRVKCCSLQGGYSLRFVVCKTRTCFWVLTSHQTGVYAQKTSLWWSFTVKGCILSEKKNTEKKGFKNF